MTEIHLYNAAELDKEEWRQLQAISREGYASTLDRTQDEVDTLVAWSDPTAFYLSHTDPNTRVGKRFNANQSYSKPRVAVAIEYGQPIGYGFSAHNVSGETEIDRLTKRLSVVKNYLWIGEITVLPKAQQEGLAVRLGKTLLKDAIPLQSPTAYIWPDEIHFLQGALERVGFTATGEQDVRIFGHTSSPVRQVRMQAASARSVLKKLQQQQ